MIAGKKEAVIDADFFNKITEEDPEGTLFKATMQELSFSPVMHRYVYEYELAANPVARKLVEANYITIEDESQFWSSDSVSYTRLFNQLYRKMNMKPFPNGKDICLYQHARENLGEIRSSLLAFFQGYNYFISDDKGAKYYITNGLSGRHQLKVMSLCDVFIEIGKITGHSIKWKDIRGLLKAELKADDFNAVRLIWVKDQ